MAIKKTFPALILATLLLVGTQGVAYAEQNSEAIGSLEGPPSALVEKAPKAPAELRTLLGADEDAATEDEQAIPQDENEQGEDSSPAASGATQAGNSLDDATPKAEGSTPEAAGQNTDTQTKDPAANNTGSDEGKPTHEGTQESPAGTQESTPKPTPDSGNSQPTAELAVQDNAELKELQEKIASEKDPKKKAALQKEFNEKYLDTLETQAAEKLSEEMAGRLTDDADITLYNLIKRTEKALDAKKEAGTLTQKDIDAFNTLLGSFVPPRKLTDKEAAINKDYKEKPYINIDESKTTEEGKKQYALYKSYKEALDRALDPKGQGLSDEDKQALGVTDIDELKAKFDEALKTVLSMIDEKTIVPSFADAEGNPIVTVYPYDFTGSINTTKPIEADKNYFIPDGTTLDIFVQLGRENDGKQISFVLRPGKLGNPAPQDPTHADIFVRPNVILLNGQEITLSQNEDGSYFFSTTNNFGVAQLKLTIPAIFGQLHEGFTLTMKVGEREITNNFLLTKKGFDENPTTGSIGTTTPQKPGKVDAGDTQDSKVNSYTDKVFSIFAHLKESDGYIDKVLVNSSKGESLPLAHVKITMRLPKNFDGSFASYIYASGLAYEKLSEGVYVLELDTKEFGHNLLEKDGRYFVVVGGQEVELTQASLDDLKGALLEGKDGTSYIDQTGTSHSTQSHKFYETSVLGQTYRIEGGSLYKQQADKSFMKLGEFSYVSKDSQVFVDKKTNTTYELKGDSLLIYSATKDVYNGHVANNQGGSANQTVTPTSPGKQVTIKENTGTKTQISYGGTIVKDAIFDRGGRYVGQSSQDYAGEKEALVDASGKKYEGAYTLSEQERKAKKKVIDGKSYTLVSSAVFNRTGYILDSYSYKDGLLLIDKLGRLIADITVAQNTDGTYRFTKEGLTKTSNGTSLIVGTTDEVIFVNSKNFLEDPSKYEAISGPYYFDEKTNRFVAADPASIIADKFYVDLQQGSLVAKTVYTYQDADKTLEVPEGTTLYHGSNKLEDFYTAAGKVYVKQTSDNKTIFVSGDELLTTDLISRIVQVHPDGSFTIQEVTSILDAVNQALFKIKFPNFLVGAHIIYELATDIVASYERVGADGTAERVSIYKTKGEPASAETSKEVVKYFTLANKSEKTFSFFKNHPAALEKNLDYHFFNIFFRDAADRQRDQYIARLLELERTSTTAEAKRKNKAALDLLALLRRALQSLTNNSHADFSFVAGPQGTQELVIIDTSKQGALLDVSRSLLWKVGFDNSEGALFPEDSDAEIIIEEHSMDNRLVFDEIVLNDTRADWQKAKEDWEAREQQKKANDPVYSIKKFAGTTAYFFLDQLKRILLGVNPLYTQGRFVPAGPAYIISRQQILDALAGTGEFVLGTGDVRFKVSVLRDSALGQVRIRVIEAFYKKGQNKQDSSSAFESPIQKAYLSWLEKTKKDASALSTDSLDSFKASFEDFIKKTYDEKSDCFGSFKEKFYEMVEAIESDNSLSEAQKQAKLVEFKTKFLAELDKLALRYLDPAKNSGNYAADDMRFNALRIELEPGLTIGGALDSSKTKYVGISSTIVPAIDIPYTDEFGALLSNKDLYLNQEIDKILQEGITVGDQTQHFDPKNWNKHESSYLQVMQEAYKRLNEKLTSSSSDKPTIKDLVEVKPENKDKVGLEKYSVKFGKDFSYSDFARGEGKDQQSLKDKTGATVNPYYVGEGEDVTTVVDNIEELLRPYAGKIDMEQFKKSDAYQSLTNPKLNIGLYYLHKFGYSRSEFANKANYKLNKVGMGPGIFGTEDTWKSKVCYPGLGQCLENAGSNKEPGEDGDEGEAETQQKAEDKFSISYTPETVEPEREYPRFDKTSDKTTIDLSNKEEGDKSVDFTITLTVDKVQADQNVVGSATSPQDADTSAKDAANYNERGYFVYKHALIIDFLPEIFRFSANSSIRLDIDENALKANGANTQGFDFEAFKAAAKPNYVADVYAYLASLTDPDQIAALSAAIARAEKEGKLDKTLNKQAVLVWLPDFEAPHGSAGPQFVLKLTGLVVDKKQFVLYEQNFGKGQPYTNHAVFDIFYAGRTITLTDHKGLVDKTMRVYDEDGKVVDAGTAKEWFGGSVELKFGDKFDYKISYTHTKPGYVDINASSRDQAAELIDIFAGPEQNHGFRPVLRELLSLKDGFFALYKLAGDEAFYAADTIEALLAEGKISLGDIVGIKIKNHRGFEINKRVEFILPMMIPNLDAVVENGKVSYVAADGTHHILGDADKFFNLDQLKDKDADLFATNTVDKSNTVTVYLKKELLIKLFKQFFDVDGTQIDNGRPEVRFDIYQVTTDEQGNRTTTKLDTQLILNEEGGFEALVEHLPFVQKSVSFDEEGVAHLHTTFFDYILKEVPTQGFVGAIEKLDGEELAFVWQAKNTKTPPTPELPPVTPPAPPTPEVPEKPGKPGKPEKPQTPHTTRYVRGALPQTGMSDNSALFLLAGLGLVALAALSKKERVR